MRPAAGTCGSTVLLALGVALAACGGPAPEMPAPAADAPLAGGQVGGNPWDIGFSTDAGQSLLVVADGRTHRVHTLNRETLEAVTSFGRQGRWAGNFESPNSLAIDSQGNLYVGDTLDGRRVQKFVHAH